MRLAVMQPYLFPSIGYFQLIHAVDAFVVYDDVNFIKRGWINRNNILGQNEAQRFTLETRGASQNTLINQVSVGSNQEKLLKSIRQSYSKAPQFSAAFPIIEKVLLQREGNLSKFLGRGLRWICDYLDLRPEWHFSSALKKDHGLRGQEKILAICEELGATHYINMPGGKELYDHRSFSRRGIRLSFIEPKPVVYHQFEGGFVPNLSIIDVMMFNDREQCSRLLREYALV